MNKKKHDTSATTKLMNEQASLLYLWFRLFRDCRRVYRQHYYYTKGKIKPDFLRSLGYIIAAPNDFSPDRFIFLSFGECEEAFKENQFIATFYIVHYLHLTLTHQCNSILFHYLCIFSNCHILSIIV